MLPIALTAVAYLLPRILLRTPEQDLAHFYAQYRELPKFTTLRFWQNVAVSWSYLWLVLPVGMFLTPRTWRPVIWRALAWAVVGTCVAGVMADDAEHMVSYLTPFVFLAVGFPRRPRAQPAARHHATRACSRASADHAGDRAVSGASAWNLHQLAAVGVTVVRLSLLLPRRWFLR